MSTSRRLAVIMFSDIAGFTRLMGEDEQRTMRILEENRKLHRESVKKYHGDYLKDIGDGTLTSFVSVADAIYCAIEIMRGATENGYQLRIGVHLGDVLFDEGDVFGDGVNIAARIETLAVPGSILMSEKVYDELRNKQDIQTKFLGKIFLKNDVKQRSIYAISNPGLEVPETFSVGTSTSEVSSEVVQKKDRITLSTSGNKETDTLLRKLFVLALVVISGVLIYNKLVVPSFDKSEFPEDIVIAVFPFEEDAAAMSSGLSSESLTTGLSEKLSLIRGMTTISSSSLTHSRDILKRANVLSTSYEESLLDSIKATHYIKGRIDSEVHIKLYSVSRKKPVWEKDFRIADSTRLFDLMGSEIARRLNLRYVLDKSGRDPRVIALYIEALSNWHNRGDTNSLFASIDLLKMAIKIDPMDAEVNGLLSLCYVNAVEREYLDFESVKNDILTYYKKALELDPRQHYGLLSKGGYYYALHQYDLAKEYYTKAHIQAPGLGITAQALAELALYTGDYHSALAYINSASKVSPYDGTILQFQVWCEMANGYANASKKLAEQYLRYYPEKKGRNYYLWADYLINKEYDRAIDAIPPELKANPIWNRLLTGIVYVDQQNQSSYDQLMKDTDPVVDKYLQILWLLHNGNDIEKAQARNMYKEIITNGTFALNNLIQTYPFASFNTFRSDPEIERIAREHFIGLSPHPYFRIQSELRK